MSADEMVGIVDPVRSVLAEGTRTEAIPFGALESQTELLDALKLETFVEELRHRYDSLHSIFDRESNRLTATLEALDSAETIDPGGEGIEALEKAEEYFRAERDKLARVRNLLLRADVPQSHDVCKALDHLDGLHAEFVETIQELRWLMLVADGKRATPTGRVFTSGTALVEALEDWAPPHAGFEPG